MHRRDALRFALALHASPALPSLLSKVQRATLASLVEMVIPGALAAGVDRFAELVLEDSDEKYRAPVIAGLARLDRLALAKHEALFHKLDERKRVALLQSMTATPFFAQLRSIVVFGYYTSKDGMEAIGWQPHAAEYQGCTHEKHRK